MIYFQSKYLAEKFNINLAKWKRWSREFLPPDPLGGLRSGYARQFSHKEAFCVYLAGYLVSSLKFTVPEAKQILADLDAWLKKEGFFALPKQSNSAREATFYHIYIFQLNDSAFRYAIGRSLNKMLFRADQGILPSAEFTVIGPPVGDNDLETIFAARVLSISTLYRFFLDGLHR